MKHPQDIRNYSKNLKRNQSIRRLSSNLFSKFQTLEKEYSYYSNQDSLSRFTQQYNKVLNPVQNLLNKANTATRKGEKLIKVAKRLSKKQKINNLFLTDTGSYETEIQRNYQPLHSIETPEDINHSDILKNLIEEQKKDNLCELRKMLKQTGENIDSCRRNVFKTHKNIQSYINAIILDSDCQKKISSMNRIISKLRP